MSTVGRILTLIIGLFPAFTLLADAQVVEPSKTPHLAGAAVKDPVHPLLRDRMAAGPGPYDVGIWFDFDPADVDFVDAFQDRRRAGVAEDEALAWLRSRVAAGNRKVLGPARRLCAELGLAIDYADDFAPVIFTRADASQVEALAADPRVSTVYPSLEGEPALASARATHRWDRVFDFGIRGDGVRVAVVEPDRVDAAGTSINVVGTYLPGQPVSAHATACAATLGSDDLQHPGYARGVELLSASASDGAAGPFMAAATWAIQQGARVLSVSWNYTVFLQLYIVDRYMDYQTRFNRITVAVAAGNSGQLSGNVKSPGLAWNVICVGNVDDGGDGHHGNDQMNPSSSFRDPISAFGDREKPEVSAVGTNITLVGAGGTAQTWTGTSFSAPSVAGIAACLMQAETSFTAWPEAVKAVLMASTYEVDGGAPLSDVDGAGSINGLQALRVTENRQFAFGTLNPGSFDGNGDYTVNVSLRRGDRCRAVICWGSNADSSYATDVLDADLDLAVYQGAGVTSGTPLAVSSSYDNSYEIVELCPPATGTYTLRIHAFRFDGASEPFGIAWAQHGEGNHAHLRPSYPDRTADDLTGPTRGNPTFRLGPKDTVNPGKVFACLVSNGTSVGIPLVDCRLVPLNADAATSYALGVQPYFLDMVSVLDPFGENAFARMNVPDVPGLVGLPLYFGMVTVDPGAPDMIEEIGVPQQIRFWDHATDLALGDDDWALVSLGFPFPFFGQTHLTVFVNSNGNLTFTLPDTTYTESVNGLLTGPPRIAAFWDDLDPTSGGKVRWRSAGDGFVIEWVDVPEFATSNQNSAMVILHRDGTIELKYRDCALIDAIAGISAGTQAQTYPVDLSHGSRTPDPLLYILPPATHESFDASNPFDLGVPDDRRTTVVFRPTGASPDNYRMTIDQP